MKFRLIPVGILSIFIVMILGVAGIYRITCLSTDKFYIGSSQNCRARTTSHLHDLRHNMHSNPKLQRAFNKYGENQFIFEIVEQCTINKLIKREQFYVDRLNPFFNIRRECVATQRGVKRSKALLNKLQKYRNLEKKPIIQIDKQSLKIIKEWESITSCSKKLDIRISNLVKACKKIGYHRTLKGFVFRYKGDYNKKAIRKSLLWKEPSRRKASPIVQYLDGQLIKRWNSITEAASFFNVHTSTIYNCLVGLCKTSVGFEWKYFKD